ncbi:MAG TPA: carboxypeptidase-like regulatory domain-containing protein [Candidatus Moranbacteria bacterium]|nr:carboxypeptidase-like regulatory domain-containing protein [Candidatus Moranbacteria bacterium]
MKKLKFLCRFAAANKCKKAGFTIIEALIVLFIFSLITVAFYQAFSLGARYILESKYRLGAISVANERMEIIRSLDYSQIGISGSGYIGGDIPDSEQITVAGRTFYVFNSVVYIDDSHDGTEGGTVDDTVPTDYKRATVKVAWENDANSDRAVSLASDFAPPGVESSAGGGTLVIKVFDKDSNGISGFNVHLANSGLGISENYATDSNGGVSLPGIPADGNDYEISVSKSNYFGIDTLPPYPTTSFHPAYVHASVTEGERNIYSITTDLTSDIDLITETFLGEAVSGVEYNLEGGIKKGDTLDDPPVAIFYFDEDLDSGSEGKNEINDIGYGAYTITVSDPGADYEFVKMYPYDAALNDKAKFSVDPGADIEEKALFANKNTNSFLAAITDSSNSLPIKNASIRLYNLSLPTPYDATLNSDDFGLVYFPESLPELAAGTYDLEIQASGYQTKNDTVIVDKLTKSDISLDPQ